MTPVETLQSEHRTIGVALDILEAICRRIDRIRIIEQPEHIDALIDFFLNFADRSHHGKEEALIYPLLEEIRTRNQGKHIWRMLREHELGREYLRGIQRAMALCGEHHAEGPEMLVYMSLGYIEVMRRHIRDENALFLDMEDKRLSEADMKRLANSFDAIEKDWFGQEQYAAYCAMPTRLGRHYIH